MRLKKRKQASKIEQKIVHPNLYLRQGLTKTVQLATILFLLIGSWGTKVAQAETARIDNITIERQPDETYESLIGRAEAAARSAVQQGFERGSQVTDVSVVVLGQNQGIIAPLLAVELSRPEWNSSNTQGTTYFNSARSLLRLEEQQLANTNNPNPNQSPEQQAPPSPPAAQQNDSNAPNSARENINSTPAQQVTPSTFPGTTPTPIPGGPTLTPRPQQPSNASDTTSGDTSNPNSTSGNTSNPNSTQGDTSNPNSTPQITGPTPVNNATPEITGPTPVNDPNVLQGTPSNNTNLNNTTTQP